MDSCLLVLTPQKTRLEVEHPLLEDPNQSVLHCCQQWRNKFICIFPAAKLPRVIASNKSTEEVFKSVTASINYFNIVAIMGVSTLFYFRDDINVLICHNKL